MKKSESPIHARWRQTRPAFAKKLRLFREGTGASQIEFAKRLRISVRTLINLEGGKYDSPEILTHLVRVRALGDNEMYQAGVSEAHDFVYGSVPRPNHVLDFRQAHRTELSVIACHYYQRKGLHTQLRVDPEKIPVLSISAPLVNEPVPLNQIDLRLIWKEQPPPFVKGTLDLAEILKERCPTLYPGFLYRFLGFTDRGSLEFCAGDYFSYLNSCEILSFELAKCIYEKRPYYEAVKSGRWMDFGKIGAALADESANFLPLRHKANPWAFRSRCTAFGTCALVVIKKTNATPQMVLNVRSKELSETPCLTHVIPAGTFQPNCTDNRFHAQEFSLQQNLIREFVEELLEDTHLRNDPGELTHFESMFNGRGRQFLDLIVKENKFSLLYLGVLIDPVNLKPEVVTVLLVHEGFLNQVTNKLYKTWETGNFRMFDFSLTELDRRIADSEFVPTGRAHLRLVKHHIREIQNHLRNI